MVRFPGFLRRSGRPSEGASEQTKASPATPETLAFREVYEAHFEWVWHALRRLSVAERDLLDASQNVFLVVHRKLPEFEGRAQLRTWIFQICRRVASDYRRSAVVRREVATETEELVAHADRINRLPDPDEQRERVRMARALLDELPEGQREVFILYELQQLSGEEIAAELDLPLGTVRSRLRLARETFRREVALLVGEASGPRVVADIAPELFDAVKRRVRQ